MPPEEELELTDIQGAIIPGFKKDHAAVIALKIGDRALAKAWLKARSGEISRASEVLQSNRQYKQFVAQHGGSEVGAPQAVWKSLSLSAGGLSALLPSVDLTKFGGAFRVGMHARTSLHDAPPAGWRIGGSAETTPHMLLVVAADEPEDLRREVDRILATVAEVASGVELLGEPEWGGTLPGDLRGHEHFGFKDGVSQPAIRGLASATAGDFIDDRLLDPKDPLFEQFAEPGRVLVWPGQFVIGYNRQSGTEPLAPIPAKNPPLAWQKNGSYLVYRRLQQKTHLFWTFCTSQATRLTASTGKALSAEAFATLLVGRWPSGAPLLRAAQQDDRAMGQNDHVNNDFLFSSAPPAVTLAAPDPAGAAFPASTPDPNGDRCPFAAHIRKVNPRDDPSDTSGPRKTRTRLLLRRGIPYGKTQANPRSLVDDGLDRGLLFMSYQTSIEEQFEFVFGTWCNLPNSPHDSDPPTGHDPLIGQSPGPRFVRCALDPDPITLDPDPWVLTTGGGYFFTPSLSALAGLLSQ